ncbi:MAG: hypothetical protein WCJ60_01985 [bacterium]
MQPTQDEKYEQADGVTSEFTSNSSGIKDTPQATEKSKLPKKVLLLIFLVAVVAIGVFVAWKLQSKNSPIKTKVTSSILESRGTADNPGSVFCTKVGLYSLQCENLDTKELKKYTLPTSVGTISYIVPSPDSQKYYVSAWTQTATGATESTLAVLNEKLELLATLPVKKDKDGQSDIYDYNVKWLNNKSLVYIKKKSDLSTKSTALVTYDVATKTEKPLATLDVNLERIMPVPDKNYLFGLQSFDVPAENSTKRKYVEVDLSTNKIKDIDQNGVTADDLSYNPSTTQFYHNILNQAAQTFDVKVYSVSNPTNSPKFTEIQHITNKYAGGTTAYEVLVTNKGLYVTNDMLQMSAPLKFIDSKGVVTDTQLAVGYNGSGILLSLPKFPDFPKAEKNDIVVNDFFQPKEGTPVKIVSFLAGKVMNDPECKKGEYTTFDNVTYDGDKQFSVGVSSCKTSALVFYVADGASYKQIAATQEGMSCEQRDKLGISAKVFSGCRLPGEGL